MIETWIENWNGKAYIYKSRAREVKGNVMEMKNLYPLGELVCHCSYQLQKKRKDNLFLQESISINWNFLYCPSYEKNSLEAKQIYKM